MHIHSMPFFKTLPSNMVEIGRGYKSLWKNTFVAHLYVQQTKFTFMEVNFYHHQRNKY